MVRRPAILPAMFLPVAPVPWLPLETPRLLLRPVRAEDADAIQAYAADPEVVRFMNWGPNTPEQTRAVLDGWLAAGRAWPCSTLDLALQPRGAPPDWGDALIGVARLSIVDAPNRTADFGYCLHRA